MNAMAHQDLPFEKVVEIVNPERSTTANPLFQVAFDWQNNLGEPFKLKGIETESVKAKDRTSIFDITLYLWENEGEVEGEIEYNIDILKRDTVIRLKENFVQLVQSAVENPELSISELSVISAGDRKLLSGFNNTLTPVSGGFVQTFFEDQAAHQPDRSAVFSGSTSMTFKELNERSNQLSRHLSSLGAKGGDVVGVCIERSVDMVVSVLGVLKAGCCYLPMDPSFPDERISYMYEDSGAKVLISQSSLNSKFRHFPDTSIVLMDKDIELIGRYDKGRPEINITVQDLAYMIYTSGSTGKPKGVKVHHEAVVNFLSSMSKKPGFAKDDSLLAVTTLSFDISVLEIFMPLSFGGKLVVADTDDIFDGDKLSALLNLHDITVMQATPATWNILLGSGWRGKSDLKALCGGEAIPPGLVKELLPRTSSLWNMYGPTETTVWSTCKQLTDLSTPILVGTPIDNTTIHIVDRNNRELPVGVVGEVCIGGLGVTKGYNNRPELTAEKFIRFGNGELIYKTGDLGRYLADGNIELFGRSDNQIKLRGFRIELGEIESLLSQLPGVKESVVKVHKFRDNDERLVAFLNTEPEFSMNAEEISGELSQNLPGYMIPSFYQSSEGFPRLPNGKINKKALILQEVETEDAPEIDFDSLTPTQQKLMLIWEETLKTRNISPVRSFFDLGGNSLLAIKTINKIKEELGLSLTFKSFLAYPTIVHQAFYIDSQTQSSAKAIELVHLTQTTNLPLTFNQKRLWLISELESDMPSYIIPFSYRFSGALDTEVFKKCLNILFNRHHVLFSVIRQINGEPYCDIIPSDVSITQLDFSGLPENERRAKVIDVFNADSVKPFDLAKGPLYRVYLITTGINEHYFHISIHHIVFDGWSWGVLVRDLNEIYNSLTADREPALKPLEYQQYDYADWEKNSVGSSHDLESVDFWEKNLKGASPVLDFPYDAKRATTSTGRGEIVTLELSREITEKMRRISKAEGASMFTAMLSVFGIQMQKYSGENDLNIGLPIAHRPHSKLENIFGMFVDTVVVRMLFEDGLTFRDVVRRTNDAAMNAIAHQDLPFARIVEIANPERSSNANPLFQVAFDWHNNLGEPLNLNGIISEYIPGIDRSAVFDITLYMKESGDIIRAEIEYNIDILKRETILRLKESFLKLVESVTENPDASLTGISMITENEKERIEGFNNTKTDYPADKTIIDLFAEQVALYPDKTAVVFKDSSLTYSQLNIKSNQLAHTLKKEGVAENNTVVIIADKSLDVIIGILAVLKAGGGYVPVDPDYPEQRIKYIVRDSGARLALVQEKYQALDLEGPRKINLNSPDSFSNDNSDLPLKSKAGDLAYIMYTSGTTGMPKGSMIWHRGVVRLVRNINYMDLTSNDRILLTGAIVFDATTFEIWGALLNGGSLYIIEKETILNPKALGEELIKNDITILWLTSALFTQISESRTDIFRKLKYLLSGGDVLSAPHINKVRRDNPLLKVINGYGPTENTTFSTTYLIEKDFERDIPIGKPVSNSTTWIFDRGMNYQPIGVVGELYVGGEGLSMGYLNREDLNQKSFLEHPYKPGERLYKTGDFARWLPDGNIEFHGRIDNQLKIRGFRVELEEIAAVISEIDGVVEAIIKPVKVQETDIRLVAFLNVQSQFTMEARDIADFIKRKLPPYMVPSAFRLMHGFPTTINGKTDRDALKVDPSEIIIRDVYVDRILTPTEKVIFDIWCEALKTTEISPTDNFFDIGGNSLMAISVFSKIGAAFSLELSLRVFFDSPRIADLANAIDIIITRTKSQMHGKMNDSQVNIIDGEI